LKEVIKSFEKYQDEREIILVKLMYTLKCVGDWESLPIVTYSASQKCVKRENFWLKKRAWRHFKELFHKITSAGIFNFSVTNLKIDGASYRLRDN
jgi:hypothetical protein